MRIGIFVTGQIRESDRNVRRSFKLLQDAFEGAEFRCATWDTEYDKHSELIDSLPDSKYTKIFPEFELDYHPYEDNPDVNMDYQYQKKLKNPNPERHLHQTKQILMHNALMVEYGKDFDIIIRTRWDATISPTINFMTMVNECKSLPAVISCVSRSQWSRSVIYSDYRATWNNPYVKHRHRNGETTKTNMNDHRMLLDSGILIHRPIDWNCNHVQDLHQRKKLLAAEFGWYQILVDGTTHHRWVFYDGGAWLTRCISKAEIQILDIMADL